MQVQIHLEEGDEYTKVIYVFSFHEWDVILEQLVMKKKYMQ